MMFLVNSSGLTVYFSLLRNWVFQACVVVNVKTGGMFFESHRMVSIPALVALWCADKRLFARARWTRTVVFFQSCDRSQCCDLTTSHAWLKSKKVIRIVLHPNVTHFLNVVSERWVPGSVNS